MNEPLYIDRPPRIQPELPSDEIEIPPPPEKENTGMSRLIQVALPLLTIVGYILIIFLFKVKLDTMIRTLIGRTQIHSLMVL